MSPLPVSGRPVIGILMDENTSSGGQSYEASKAYFRAVSAAGGVPLGLSYDPATPELAVQTCHGLVICGGRIRFPDAWYRDGVATDAAPSERVAVEQDLIAAWMATGRPFLGICHGMQAFACFHGARMVPDLKADNPLAQTHHGPGARHDVTVTPGTLLAGLTGAGTIPVNSLHREAVVDPGPVLQVSALAPDGTIEAVELPGHRFALGLQWHPERLAAGVPEANALEKAPASAVFAGLVTSSRLGSS